MPSPQTGAFTKMLLAGAALAAAAGELRPPVQVVAGGKPIDVERDGHSAPFFGDLDGDGRRDLLVGEYYQGRLRIYRNVGTDHQPRFDESSWFTAGTELGRVPTG
jgi:FG-GAP repeat